MNPFPVLYFCIYLPFLIISLMYPSGLQFGARRCECPLDSLLCCVAGLLSRCHAVMAAQLLGLPSCQGCQDARLP